ncbi:MAG: tryptophan--tRNA ligase, partial [Proteobacteria bacterium]
PELVPVGEDQVAHIEMCREIARRFNWTYTPVEPETPDAEHLGKGGIFPIPDALVGRVGRLVGTDGKNKMSKSLGNVIYLTDSSKEIKKKLNALYTGRQSMTEPGDIQNSLFSWVRAFIKDPAKVAELEDRYSRGDNIGDGHVKADIAIAIDELLAPMRERRAALEGEKGDARVLEILRAHVDKANAVAEKTLYAAKEAMQLDFGRRVLHTST